MMKSVAFLSLSIAALVGCGGDDPKKPVVTVDAPGSGSNNPTPDAPPAATCTMASSNAPAAVAEFTFTADHDDMMAGEQQLWQGLSLLNQDMAPDGLFIELWEGYTIADFSTATAQNPITVQLTGDEASFATCGACVYGITDYTGDMANPYADDYFASGGTLTITAATPTSFKATLSNLTLTHVDIDQETLATTPNASGCSSTIASLTIDAVPAMMKNGSMRITARKGSRN